MKRNSLIGLVIILLTACSIPNKKEVTVYFENNSDMDSILTIKTYLNDTFYKTIQVRRNRSKIYDTSLIVSYEQVNNNSLKLKFMVDNKQDSTSCLLPVAEKDTVSYVHVNFLTIVFKKGYVVYEKTLERDSVVEHQFYCELVPRIN